MMMIWCLQNCTTHQMLKRQKAKHFLAIVILQDLQKGITLTTIGKLHCIHFVHFSLENVQTFTEKAMRIK